jgi:hypothetical protein
MYSDVVGATICRLTLSLTAGCTAGTFSPEPDSVPCLASTDPTELALPSVKEMNVMYQYFNRKRVA